MPNHFHAIITIRDIEIPLHAPPPFNSDAWDTDAPVGAGSPRPDQDGAEETAAARGAETAPLPGRRLGEIVARFKYETTKVINQSLGTPGQPLWQRNYWESCINTERQYANVEECIIENPRK